MPPDYDLNLSTELIPSGKKNRPGDKLTPSFITVHNTDNPNEGADANAHSKFVRTKGYYLLNGKKNWVSWHFTVDDKETIKQLPVDEVGFHAGKGNTRSVAIEQCMHEGISKQEADERLCQLIAQLRIKLDLDRERVVTHKHWTGKNCPSQLIPRWDAMMDRVDQIVGDSRNIDDDLVRDTEKDFAIHGEIPKARQNLLDKFDNPHRLEIAL